MTVKEVIELIQSLCVRHPEINGFYTGLDSQHNDEITQYPAVRIVFPFEIVPNSDPSNEAVTIKFKTTVRVNKAKVVIDMVETLVNVNYKTENSVINEIDNSLLLENSMRDDAARLATHLIEWLKLSEDNYSYFSVKKATIIGMERAEADYTTGVNILFEFVVGNPYVCEARELFETTAL